MKVNFPTSKCPSDAKLTTKNSTFGRIYVISIFLWPCRYFPWRTLCHVFILKFILDESYLNIAMQHWILQLDCKACIKHILAWPLELDHSQAIWKNAPRIYEAALALKKSPPVKFPKKKSPDIIETSVHHKLQCFLAGDRGSNPSLIN